MGNGIFGADCTFVKANVIIKRNCPKRIQLNQDFNVGKQQHSAGEYRDGEAPEDYSDIEYRIRRT